MKGDDPYAPCQFYARCQLQLRFPSGEPVRRTYVVTWTVRELSTQVAREVSERAPPVFGRGAFSRAQRGEWRLARAASGRAA